MIKQINVGYDLDQVRGLDRIAAKQSISRTDFLRKLADEAIAADLAGRELFAAETEELSPTDVRHLIEENKKLNAELARSQDQFIRREKKLLGREEALAARVAKLEAEAAAAMKVARDEVEDRLTKRLESFEQSIVGGIEDFGHRLVDGFTESPQSRAMNAKSDRMLELAAEPRHVTKVQIGNGYFSMPGFLGLLAFMVIPGGLLFGILAKLFPILGVPYAIGILGNGDTATCRTMRAEYANTRECEVKSTKGAVIATASIPRNRR